MPKYKNGQLVDTHTDLQKFAEQYALALGKPCFHIPNYNVRRIGPGKFIAAKGAKTNNGCPDLIVVGVYRTAYLEIKVGKDRLRPEQEMFKNWCDNAGHYWRECRTREDLEREISCA